MKINVSPALLICGVAIIAILVGWTLSSGPFSGRGAFDRTKPGQREFFHSVDILLSAALIAGGADGIHSIVNAMTTFFNNTAGKKPQS